MEKAISILLSIFQNCKCKLFKLIKSNKIFTYDNEREITLQGRRCNVIDFKIKLIQPIQDTFNIHDPGKKSFRGVAVITSALHAEGPQFDPGRKHIPSRHNVINIIKLFIYLKINSKLSLSSLKIFRVV